jgi:hypothetical protein
MDIADRVAIQDYRDWANGTRNTVKFPSKNGNVESQIYHLSQWLPYAATVGTEVIILSETTWITGESEAYEAAEGWETYRYFLLNNNNYYESDTVTTAHPILSNSNPTWLTY